MPELAGELITNELGILFVRVRHASHLEPSVLPLWSIELDPSTRLFYEWNALDKSAVRWIETKNEEHTQVLARAVNQLEHMKRQYQLQTNGKMKINYSPEHLSFYTFHVDTKETRWIRELSVNYHKLPGLVPPQPQPVTNFAPRLNHLASANQGPATTLLPNAFLTSQQQQLQQPQPHHPQAQMQMPTQMQAPRTMAQGDIAPHLPFISQTMGPGVAQLNPNYLNPQFQNIYQNAGNIELHGVNILGAAQSMFLHSTAGTQAYEQQRRPAQNHGQYKCEICCLYLETERALMQHKASKSHKRRAEKIRNWKLHLVETHQFPTNMKQWVERSLQHMSVHARSNDASFVYTVLNQIFDRVEYAQRMNKIYSHDWVREPLPDGLERLTGANPGLENEENSGSEDHNSDGNEALGKLQSPNGRTNNKGDILAKRAREEVVPNEVDAGTHTANKKIKIKGKGKKSSQQQQQPSALRDVQGLNLKAAATRSSNQAERSPKEKAINGVVDEGTGKGTSESQWIQVSDVDAMKLEIIPAARCFCGDEPMETSIRRLHVRKHGPKKLETMIHKNEIVGTNTEILKEFTRSSGVLKPENIRPKGILQAAFAQVKKQFSKGLEDYEWMLKQLKSIRQDLQTQNIEDAFTVQVYQYHAKLAIANGDIGELNTCLTRLRDLYQSVPSGDEAEFRSYHIFYCMFSGQDPELAQLPDKVAKLAVIQNAIRIYRIYKHKDFYNFFKTYQDQSEENRRLMDLVIHKVRYLALCVLVKGFSPPKRKTSSGSAVGELDDQIPTLPIEFLQQVFQLPDVEHCKRTLRHYGAVFTRDGDMNLADTQPVEISGPQINAAGGGEDGP